MPETTYRHTIWQIVYAYMLTTRSSWFNKKTFVRYTITRLASAINTTYYELLAILTDKTGELPGTTVAPAELYRLLSELKAEATTERFRTIATHAVNLYKTLEEIFKDDSKQQLQVDNKEAIIDLLTHPDSCRLFLQPLKEEEIIRWIGVLIPSESKFAVTYAHSLDRQQTQGYLAGKTGSEFTKLKWQFILPLLFANRGSSLNRKHFVYAVIQQVAAHYNLSFTELLVYFNRQETLLQVDKELKNMLTALWKDLPSGSTPIHSHSSLPTAPALKTWFLILNRHPEQARVLTRQQEKQLFRQFAASRPWRQLSGKWTEQEQKQLIRFFFKKESTFIFSYTASLEKQEITRKMEGKTGHHFRQLKWEFIWTVLTRDTPDGFNRRYFVAHMLKTMAGHYNLSYIELLSYFCIEPGHRLFSREIQTILQTLCQEEIRQLIRLAGPFISAGSQHPLLLTHLQINVLSQATGNPADPTWIMEFLEFLNTCKQAGILPHISASAFRTVVWQQTLSLLFLPGPNRKSIHKSRFIKQLMEQLAQQYQVSLPMLIKEIQQKTRHLKKIPSEIQSLDSPNKAGTPPVSPPASETIRTSSKATPVDAIPEYLQFLTACKQAGLLPHIATARFQAAVWQEAIQLLNTPVHRNKWDKTLFLNQLLEQLADHYQLSWTGLINSIRQHLPPTGHIPVEIQCLLTQHLPGETLPIESPASFRFLGSVPRQIEVNNAGVVLLSPWFPPPSVHATGTHRRTYIQKRRSTEESHFPDSIRSF